MENKIVIIPTLNERKNLESLIPGIFSFMTDVSILIVDDDSRDGTQESVRELQSTYSNLHFLQRKNNFGYGRSTLDGFQWSIERGFGQIATMDADFSHDYRSLPVLFMGLGEADVAIGSRYVRGGKLLNWSFYRRLLSRFANAYATLILGLEIKDATSGFIAYRSFALKRLSFDILKSNGYAFLIELKYRLMKSGIIFVEVPITFVERREGQSKMSFKIIWESIWLPWRLLLQTGRWNDIL